MKLVNELQGRIVRMQPVDDRRMKAIPREDPKTALERNMTQGGC